MLHFKLKGLFPIIIRFVMQPSKDISLQLRSNFQKLHTAKKVQRALLLLLTLLLVLGRFLGIEVRIVFLFFALFAFLFLFVVLFVVFVVQSLA
jgi:hypothetical protein